MAYKTFIRKIVTTLFIFLFGIAAYAQVYQTKSLNPNIKSVQIENYRFSPLHPVIRLNSDEEITLSFDDLSPELTTYSYKIIHCNANWQASDLQESEYIDGFYSDYISNQEFSVNTYFTYSHFQESFPNDNFNFKISGNYVVIVYPNNEDDKPVLQACFSVVDPTVNIEKAVATPITNIDYKKEHQQVEFEINYTNSQINQPEQEIFVVVEQNRRRDNRVLIPHPNYFEINKLKYRNNNKLIFEAGNEYRTFDISAQYILSNRVESIKYFKPYFHATLYPEEYRFNREYEYVQDVSGRYIVNVQFSDQSYIDGDYYFTHFTLPMDEPFLNGEMHIIGDLTENRISNLSKMTYNYNTKAYESVLLLKQGGYNYLYAYVPQYTNHLSFKEIEGNKWETENEYSIYVYYRPFGANYDRLIAFRTIISNRLIY